MNEPLKRPSLREAARRGVEANRQARQPAAPTPPATTTAAKPAPRTEQVAAKCGHAVPFELYPDGKDKWRESRRKLITDRDCPDCRKSAGAARQAAEQEAARSRRAERARRPPAVVRERLPHGSRYDVSYDAGKEAWAGTLTVPDATADGTRLHFAASASGVFRLLRRLDDLYRATAAETPDVDVNRDEGGEG